MMSRDYIPKVVASEMGTVQTFVMKLIVVFLREGTDYVKGNSRCYEGVVSSVRAKLLVGGNDY